MHARRWLTAFICLPLLLVLLWRGPGWGWLLLLVAVDLLAHWEFLNLAGLSSSGLGALNLGAGLLLLLAFAPGLPHLPVAVLLLSLFALMGYFLWAMRPIRSFFCPWG